MLLENLQLSTMHKIFVIKCDKMCFFMFFYVNILINSLKNFTLFL